MRRVLGPDAFAAWLARTLPGDAPAQLAPVSVTDRSDGRLAHLDGLNLSRAWMMASIADGLPDDHAAVGAWRASSAEHARVALASIDGAHYEGSHWLGTFACYLLTRAADAHSL